MSGSCVSRPARRACPRDVSESANGQAVGGGEAMDGGHVHDRTLWRVPGGGILYRTPALSDARSTSTTAFCGERRSTRTPDSDAGPGEAPAKDDRASSAHPDANEHRPSIRSGSPRPDHRHRALAGAGPGRGVPHAGRGPRSGLPGHLQRPVGAGCRHRPGTVGTTGYSFDSIPVVVGGTLYTGSGGRLFGAVNAVTGPHPVETQDRLREKDAAPGSGQRHGVHSRP